MHLNCDPWLPITIWKLVINIKKIYLALPSLLDENVHVNKLHGALVDNSEAGKYCRSLLGSLSGLRS